MPYSINESDGEFWVENANTGRRMHKRPYRSRKEALRYQRALEANVNDAKSVKHGGFHSSVEKDRLQAIHDHAAGLGADCGGMDEGQAKGIKAAKYMLDMGMDEEGGEAYARQELSDISTAAYALTQLALLSSEMDEPDDAREVAALMRGLCNFIMGEIDEMEQAATSGEAKAVKETVPAQVKAKEPEPKKSLDMAYIKALGLEIPADKLAVKFTGRDEIVHPVFLWGDPARLDVEKDFFTHDTDFFDSVYGKSPRPLTWDHGQDKLFKEASPVIGKSVEWQDDEIGRWVTSVLDKDRAYRKFLDELIEQKALGSSSDSAPQYVIREKSGKGFWIKQWPWIASALTPMPAEPRMKEFTPEFLKAWHLEQPEAGEDRSRQIQVLALRERELRLHSTQGG